MKKYVKVLALGLMLAAQAKASFVGLPIHCGAIRGNNAANTDQVIIDIRQPGDSPILAVVNDHNDVARMYCVKTTVGSGQLDCRGAWANDKSPARLKATIGTYVPFVTMLRSQSLFHGATITGVCVQQ